MSCSKRIEAWRTRRRRRQRRPLEKKLEKEHGALRVYVFTREMPLPGRRRKRVDQNHADDGPRGDDGEVG